MARSLSVLCFSVFSFLKLELKAGNGGAGGKRGGITNKDSSFLVLPFQKHDTEAATLGTI